MHRVKAWRRPGASGVLYCADALELLQSQRAGSADVVFLDPPFNLGKRYSKDQPRLDRKPQAAYEDWLGKVLSGAIRILAPGGSLFFYHLPQWATCAAAILDDELTFRHWIAIAMKNGFARGNKLYPAHYALLYYTKGSPKNFNRPKLDPPKCRHCKGLIKDYGGYTSIIEEKGLNLSDVWDDVSPVRHAANKFRNANELPRTITDRVVKIAGVRDGVFFDPFAGSGTTLLSAVGGEMRFRAGDLLKKNCVLVRNRIDSLKSEARLAGGVGGNDEKR